MRILVIGDIIQDRYIHGTSTRLNPEGPVPLIKFQKQTVSLGGAANVWNNLVSLGLDADLVEYDEEFQSIKTRILCDGHYVTRLDEDRKVDGSTIVEKVKNMDISKYEYVILSDYDKGALDCTKDLLDLLRNKKIIVDPKRNVNNFNGAWLIKANELEDSMFDLSASWNNNYIVTAAGNKVVSRYNDEFYSSYPAAAEVSDVTGAGDCFIAAFVYGLTKLYDWQKCLNIATNAATISVRYSGTYVLQPKDVEDIIVFTNGCFDILHRGHIQYLEQSKKLGTKLIVGLNSDASVKRLKGSSRPVNSELDRKHALEALRVVDEVVIFNEDTPLNLIKQLMPDFITKGGDYSPDSVVGNELAKVIILPYIEGFSTTRIINTQ